MNSRSKPKYRSRKTVVDGITFDSKREAKRYQELSMLLVAGEISDLKLQESFELIPAQRRNGKVAERACKYVADFVYQDKEGTKHVEDSKGVRTPEYIIKRKLMLYIHGIQIEEV